MVFMDIVLYDDASWRQHLLPLVATRPVGNLRVGVLTLDAKWQLIYNTNVHFFTVPHLRPKFQPFVPKASSYLIIRANSCPTASLLACLDRLTIGQLLMDGTDWVALKTDVWPTEIDLSAYAHMQVDEPIVKIVHLEDIISNNAAQLAFDYALISKGRESAPLSATNRVIGPQDQLFLESGVLAEGCSFNTLGGPIYVAANAQLEEGSLLRGPIGIGAAARVKMGARIYGNVTVGPGSTVGGELAHSVLWGNSAKGHDGYLGCSVLGEGVNLGAGTSNSNLLNTWGPVFLYDYQQKELRATGKSKIGAFIGDYAMCAINSSLTTGCVIGVGAQVALSDFIPKFVADFSWVTTAKLDSYRWTKFEDMLQQRAALMASVVSAETIAVLAYVHQQAVIEKENNQTK